MLTLGWHGQAHIVVRFVIGKIIEGYAEYLRQELAFIKIRDRLSRFSFSDRLSCDAKLFGDIFLGHSQELASMDKIILEHPL